MNQKQNKILEEDMKRIYKACPDYEMFRDKNVLVTGAFGMLSFYIVRFLAYLNEQGISVGIYALVRNQSKADGKYDDIEEKGYFHYVVSDVCDKFETDEKIDYIFHMAGNANPKNIRENPMGIIRANTVGTMNVLDFAKKNGTEKVFFASTREVYGKLDKETISEDDMGVMDCLEARACYPESKKMAENLLVSYQRQFDINYVIGRIAHVYGPGMNILNDGRIMSDLISDVVNQRNIVLKSDGAMERAFCYLSDAVAAIFTVMRNGQNTVYNIANETEPIQVRKLASLMTKLYNGRSEKVVFDIPEKKDMAYSKIGRTRLNLEKLYQEGFVPEVSLEEGIRKTVDFFVG